MSNYLDCYIEKYNPETNQWENLSLYKKERGEYKPVDVYGFSSYGCGDTLCGSCYDNYSLAITRPRGIPADASLEVKEAYGDGKYLYNETWYDYCELNAYRRAIDKLVKPILDMAKSNDESSEECCDDITHKECQEEIEHFEGFMHRIDNVIHEYEVWNPKYGEIRIVIWIG